MKLDFLAMVVLPTLAAVITFSCPGPNPPGNAPPPTVTEVHTTRSNIQKTSSGVTVASKAGVSADVLNAVDAGWKQAIADGKASGYTQKLEASNYTVLIPDEPCQPSTEQQIPSFKVRADNYDGSQYDLNNPLGQGVKDGIGIIWASEMVASYEPKIEAFVCPEVAQNGTDYGFEHGLVKFNDPAYYAVTATHTAGGHPILPHRP
jgi:hypothetical protein